MAQASSMENLVRKPHLEADIEHRERGIEREITQKVPPTLLLGLAVGSMVVSAAIAIFGRQKETANFVGLWAPSFLLIGIYNKLTRLEESEEIHPERRVA